MMRTTMSLSITFQDWLLNIFYQIKYFSKRYLFTINYFLQFTLSLLINISYVCVQELMKHLSNTKDKKRTVLFNSLTQLKKVKTKSSTVINIALKSKCKKELKQTFTGLKREQTYALPVQSCKLNKKASCM